MRVSLILPIASLLGSLAALPSEQTTPETVVLDGPLLVQTKRRIQQDGKLKAELEILTRQADYWLDKGPWTVTSKTSAPPNGTLHDYASQAPYFWPNPNSADGCPYKEKDGVRNPEVDKYTDRPNISRMFNSTYVLTLAWFYTGKPEYAQHAAQIVTTWFLDPDTAMNPNLNHAQIVPCANDGRSIGIIDFSQEYTNVVDAVAILSTGAPGWDETKLAAFKDWNKRFLAWLTDSPFGKQEAAQSNNHGTFAHMQIAALALFTGNRQLASDLAQVAKTTINNQFTANGSQPQELSRATSFHYSNFNLGAHLRWALISQKVGVDLFRYKGPAGQSLAKGVEFLIPAAVGGASKWTYPELNFTQYAATDNIHAAALAGLCQAKTVDARLVPPPGGDIFYLRPAAQQLDSILVL
ncbi:hypothetical protein NQ176_g6103 [Zarea fungicola]|uniref:Uncharacterized protein n=1 Tax=Zarea fungicola TaxID=93591 RepID=A0ACC1N5L9_9HYPO|nr:hypothetical protein NQ176_g6103 [Lecanicillium fungicola]